MRKILFLLGFLNSTVGFSQTFTNQLIELLPPIYNEISFLNSNFLTLKSNNKTEYFDKKNRVVFPNYYTEIDTLYKGYAAVNQYNKSFHIDSLGNTLYQKKYDKASVFIHHIALVAKGKKQYLINTEGEVLFKKKNVNIKTFNKHFILYEKNNQSFLVDFKNKVLMQDSIKTTNGIIYKFTPDGLVFANEQGKIIKTNYRELNSLSKKFYHMKTPTYEAIVDKNFEEVVRFKYLSKTDEFNENAKNDSIVFLYNDKKKAIFNKNSGEVSDFKFDQIAFLRDSFYRATTNNIQSLVNAKGEIISKLGFLSISTTNSSKKDYKNSNKKYFAVSNSYKNANFMDNNGNLLFSKETGLSDYTTAEMLNDTTFIVQKDRFYGIINHKEEIIVPIKYSKIHDLNNGIAQVILRTRTNNQKKSELGLVNFKGDYIATQSEEFGKYTNGYFVFESRKKFSIIDSTFKVILPFDNEFTDVKNMQEGLFAVQKNKKYGFIDTNGKTVIDYKHDLAESFVNGLARINFRKYINQKGEVVIDSITFENDLRFNYQMAAIKYKGKWGVYNNKYSLQILPMYDEAEVLNNNFIKVKLNNLWGIVNTKNQEIIAIKYKEILSIEGAFYTLIDQDEKQQIIQIENDKIIKTNYFFVKELYSQSETKMNRDKFYNKQTKMVLVEQNGKFGLIEISLKESDKTPKKLNR